MFYSLFLGGPSALAAMAFSDMCMDCDCCSYNNIYIVPKFPYELDFESVFEVAQLRLFGAVQKRLGHLFVLGDPTHYDLLVVMRQPRCTFLSLDNGLWHGWCVERNPYFVCRAGDAVFAWLFSAPEEEDEHGTQSARRLFCQYGWEEVLDVVLPDGECAGSTAKFLELDQTDQVVQHVLRVVPALKWEAGLRRAWILCVVACGMTR